MISDWKCARLGWCRNGVLQVIVRIEAECWIVRCWWILKMSPWSLSYRRPRYEWRGSEVECRWAVLIGYSGLSDICLGGLDETPTGAGIENPLRLIGELM